MALPLRLSDGNPVDRRSGRVLAFAFSAYKAIVSPMLHAVAPSRCLYVPTCSEYCYVALSRFGYMRGSWLAMRRLARCNPWGKGGFDPVPENLSQPHVGAETADERQTSYHK